MNPPNLEICFEGYNTDQTDFYIGQLIEKINALESTNKISENRIEFLETENRQLRNELLMLVKQLRNNNCSADGNPDEFDIKASDEAFKESKNEVNSAIKESLDSIRIELNSVKDFIRNN